MGADMKRRVTLTLDPQLLEQLDRAPGSSRSEKAERLLEEALAYRARTQWVRELEAFYTPERVHEEAQEDRDWQGLIQEALHRDD